MSRTSLLHSAFVLALALSLANCGGSAGSPAGSGGSTADAAPKYTVDISDFNKDIAANEAAVKAKYDGQVIKVTGPITGIESTAGGDIYISIGGNPVMSSNGLNCFFADKKAEPWAVIAKGQKVTLQGKLDLSYQRNLLETKIVDPGAPAAIKMTAAQLADSFAKDQKALEESCKDKNVIIEGDILAKSANDAGAPNLTLKGNGTMDVQCNFTAFAPDPDMVKPLTVGQHVKIFGEVQSLLDSKPTVYFCKVITK